MNRSATCEHSRAASSRQVRLAEMEKVYRTAELKRYSLELYALDAPNDLLWKVDSDDPFTPMTKGDRILPMDAPSARPDEIFEIAAIEHLLWTAGERVRYVTRIYTRTVKPIG